MNDSGKAKGRGIHSRREKPYNRAVGLRRAMLAVLVSGLGLHGCGASIIDRDWISTLESPNTDGSNGFRFNADETYVRLSSARTLVPDGASYCVMDGSDGVFADLGDRVLLDERSVLYYRFEGGRLLLEPPAADGGEDPSFYEVYNAVRRVNAPGCRRRPGD